MDAAEYAQWQDRQWAWPPVVTQGQGAQKSAQEALRNLVSRQRL
eukprot:SAG25_NODE_8860_length_400_cov_0.993355_2_plen_43_part_01